MINTNLLKGRIVSKGLTQRKMAKMLGIAEKTFYDKMKRGVFTSNEIEAMMVILDIDNPVEIFFCERCSGLSDKII